MLSPLQKSYDRWDTCLYGQHSFVAEYGRDLLDLTAISSGERVLDIGCGTGLLTSELATRGACVVGIDSSSAMIDAASKAYPQLTFAVADICEFVCDRPFNLLFSNATLHWARPETMAAQRMADALAPGGRIVVEFGGAGNVATIRAGVEQALIINGMNPGLMLNLWYNPTLAEYTTLLESVGLTVRAAWWFQRPTLLAGKEGMQNWLEMFVRPHLSGDPASIRQVLIDTERLIEHELYRDNKWYADYARLRVVAFK